MNLGQRAKDRLQPPREGSLLSGAVLNIKWLNCTPTCSVAMLVL